jgi:hypothetical protein
LEIEELGTPLPEVNDVDSIASLSSFGGSIFTTTILGRCLNHLRTYEQVATSKLTSKFWISHQQIDTSISLIFLNMPNHLRASQAEGDVNVVLSQFNLHVTIILLHQFALKIAARQKMEQHVRRNSFQRCLASALEIKNITYSLRDLTIFSVRHHQLSPPSLPKPNPTHSPSPFRAAHGQPYASTSPRSYSSKTC